MVTDPLFRAFQQELSRLVDSFRKRAPHFKSEGYDESQLRTDFLNPFWKALGWDIENRSEQPQSLREVQVETRVHIAGRKKRADYVFRTGGIDRFVCEAKKAPDELTKKGAFQTQRYAYNLKLFVAILTNFERFQIFIVGGLPDQGAPFPSYLDWHYLELPDKAQEIWGLFSKEAVTRHAIEQLVDSLKKKPLPGKTRQGWLFVPERVRTVDEEFLDYIERKRDVLAHLLVEVNTRQSWTDFSLNECIQRILDRILFIRICEDRDIDTGRSLEAILKEWEDIRTARPPLYPRLVAHFNSLDESFNGTLFAKGHESERLRVPDSYLVDLIRELSSEDSPYLFSTLPVEILGSVYEKFIGKVVRLTRGGNVRIEEKPEVRHAGGVYYTPRYVVNYIVEQTVGRLIERRSPITISSLKILDPACGSGSFLLRVFERICEEYISWLTRHPNEQRKQDCYKDDTGTLHLTTHLKRQIMMNNVFGVDIDYRAVEVTMLSLYLKILEGETRTTLGMNFSLFPKETFLPDLNANIKCGNSLISDDFYAGDQVALLSSPAVRQRINAFNWNTEFKSIVKNGFDCVIGNPPYVLLQDDLRDDEQLAYFRMKYAVASYKIDTYHLFIERGILLTKSGGFCSMITPANFLANNYLAALRRFLLDRTAIDHILVIDGGVFEGVSVNNAIFVVTAGKKTKPGWAVIHAVPTDEEFKEVSILRPEIDDADKKALFTTSGRASAVWKRILQASVRLGDIADINFGKQLRDRTEYPRDVIEVPSYKKIPSGYEPCYTGKNVKRYRLKWEHLACLDREVARRGGCWDPTKQNAKNKLITPQIGQFPVFALDTKGYQCLNTMFMVNIHPTYDPWFILGFLNSLVIKTFWLDHFFDQRRTFPKIKGEYLAGLPIFSTSQPTKLQTRQVNEIAELAKALVNLTNDWATSTSDHDKNATERRMRAAEARIDELIFALYELSQSDINLVSSLSDPTSFRENVFPTRSREGGARRQAVQAVKPAKTRNVNQKGEPGQHTLKLFTEEGSG